MTKVYGNKYYINEYICSFIHKNRIVIICVYYYKTIIMITFENKYSICLQKHRVIFNNLSNRKFDCAIASEIVFLYFIYKNNVVKNMT